MSQESKFEFVESVPADCHFPPDTKFSDRIGIRVIEMLKKAKKSIKAISFYFTLRGKDVGAGPYQTDNVGEEVYRQLEEAAKRDVKIHLLANIRREGMEDSDMGDLQNEYPNQVSVGFVDMSHKNPGHVGGILHSKLWIIDDELFYVGSSNMDWRSYTEIVECGIVGQDTSYVMDQLNKIYLETCKLSETKGFVADLLERCGDSFKSALTKCDAKAKDLAPTPVVVSSSPDIVSRATGTRTEKAAMLDVINTAQKHLLITTYVYSAADRFTKPELLDLDIQNAIRSASLHRNVEVDVVVDEHSVLNKSYNKGLHYLAAHSNIKIWVFKIENKSQPEIPFAKLWHSKLIISESKLWVSTNNINVAYWTVTCGISLVFDSTVGPRKEETLKIIEDATNHVVRYLHSEYVKRMELSPQVLQELEV